MKKPTAIRCVFVDIGGVLLTDGWNRHTRQRAATHFDLDLAEMEDRHHLVFELYEVGKLTLREYLDRVVFYRERPFTRADFRAFMFAQSRPDAGMLALMIQLKHQYRLKMFVVSNEARELNLHRIRTFRLDRWVDCFVSSSFVHLRKPDVAIFRMALDLAQVPAPQVVFIDNTAMHVQIAEGLGMHGIVHQQLHTTRAALATLGLPCDESIVDATR